MIQILVAVGNPLQRSALSALLARESDLEVVGEVSRCEDLEHAVLPGSPRVTLFHSEAADRDVASTVLWLCQACPYVLMLTDAHRHGLVSQLARARPYRIGFLTTQVSADQLVGGVRSLAMGQPVVDPELTVAALTIPECPLTSREQEILGLAAEGVSAREIANRLRLATGTVRNYLARINGKIGASTLMEAARVAQRSGWLLPSYVP
jgi:two-component system, NarL family, response regulator DesR